MTCRAGTRDAEDPLSLVAGPADRGVAEAVRSGGRPATSPVAPRNRPDPTTSGPGLGAGVPEAYGEGVNGTPASSSDPPSFAQEPRSGPEAYAQVSGPRNRYIGALSDYPGRWLFGG